MLPTVSVKHTEEKEGSRCVACLAKQCFCGRVLMSTATTECVNIIEALVQVVHHDWAVPCGWWNDLQTNESLRCDYPGGERPKGSKNVGDQLMLIASEIGEAYEGHRKNKMDEHCPAYTNFEIELADALIRILDTAGGLNLDLGGAFLAKMQYNRRRADHKPENRRAEDGKKS